jgi:hypothetical protein
MCVESGRGGGRSGNGCLRSVRRVVIWGKMDVVVGEVRVVGELIV